MNKTQAQVDKCVAMEKEIVMQAVAELTDAGFVCMIDYGDYQEEPATAESIQACDEEVLRAYKNGKRFGYVHLVYGNDGYDVINDTTTNMQPYLVKTAALAESYEAGAG